MSGGSSTDCLFVVSLSWKTRAYLKAMLMEELDGWRVFSVTSVRDVRSTIDRCKDVVLVLEFPLETSEFEKEWLKLASDRVSIVVLGHSPEWLHHTLHLNYPITIGEIVEKLKDFLASHEENELKQA